MNATTNNIYDIPVFTIDGERVTLESYRGKVLLIVNVASRCGCTPQYAGFEELYQTYKDLGLVVLGFPCNQFLWQEPSSESDIKSFCSLKYKVTFPLFAKIKVNGRDAHPLFTHLKNEARGFLGTRGVKWNFTKFLVDREGNVVKRFGTFTPPRKMKQDIEKLLA